MNNAVIRRSTSSKSIYPRLIYNNYSFVLTLGELRTLKEYIKKPRNILFDLQRINEKFIFPVGERTDIFKDFLIELMNNNVEVTFK